MKTEQIYVNGEEARIAAAMDKTMAFAELVGLDSKQSLRLRLIAEEILGLLSGITDNDYTALFWIEGNARRCETHLAAKIDMTAERREELLATATTGRNEAATGIMGKIRDMIGVGILGINEAAGVTTERGDGAMMFYDAGENGANSEDGLSVWTLENYRDTLRDKYGDDGDDDGSWDELERSIIANLADDVRVAVRMDKVEIAVLKTFR